MKSPKVRCLSLFNETDERIMSQVKYNVFIEDTDEVIHCTATQNILQAMEQLGRKGIPVGCRGGGCGVCKIQITSGEYITEKMSDEQVSDVEREAGYSLACRTFPKSEIQLRVVGKMAKSVMRGVSLPACWRASNYSQEV